MNKILILVAFFLSASAFCIDPVQALNDCKSNLEMIKTLKYKGVISDSKYKKLGKTAAELKSERERLDIRSDSFNERIKLLDRLAGNMLRPEREALEQRETSDEKAQRAEDCLDQSKELLEQLLAYASYASGKVGDELIDFLLPGQR